VAIATLAGVGFAPVAPGTFGSALALPIFVILSPLSPMLFGLTVTGLFFLGSWAADGAGARFGRTDDGRIVIDEVVGQLLALTPLLLLPVCAGGLLAGSPGCGPTRSEVFWPLVTGFVLFRLFDIWKPGAVRWAERSIPGGYGVMMDDVLAGLLAAAVLATALVWMGSGAWWFGAGAAALP